MLLDALVLAIIYLLLPLVVGLAFAHIKCRLSVRGRCSLAFWCPALLFFAITLGPGLFVASSHFKEALVRAVLGFFTLAFLPCILASGVCRVTLMIKGRWHR